jgi:hypothetical protein
MTDLIAAGFLVSYSGGLLLLPLFFAHWAAMCGTHGRPSTSGGCGTAAVHAERSAGAGIGRPCPALCAATR